MSWNWSTVNSHHVLQNPHENNAMGLMEYQHELSFFHGGNNLQCVMWRNYIWPLQNTRSALLVTMYFNNEIDFRGVLKQVLWGLASWYIGAVLFHSFLSLRPRVIFCIFSAIDGIPPLACHSLFALLGSYPLVFLATERILESTLLRVIGEIKSRILMRIIICGCQATRWSLRSKRNTTWWAAAAEIRQMSTTSFWHPRACK
jgi:hypothetical protein